MNCVFLALPIFYFNFIINIKMQFFYDPDTKKQFRSLKAAKESIRMKTSEAMNVDDHSQVNF